MENMIRAMNEIHDAFSEVKIDDRMDLPQIVVVGGQSSGKSSVLENIVGRDFLPRGAGMVTRCPLVLQLIQTFKQSEEWAEFAHHQGKRFTNFDEVREEIVAQTNRLSPNLCVSGTSINLRIHSPHVLNLTLVDLPGLVATPIEGQPADIADQIRNMVKKYVSKSNTIILAITAANQDIATSVGLQLAKEVDPTGLRTLGVLTKLDSMDPGTDALNVLKNNAITLRKGFIGVVNRSQRDINENKKITEARKAEIAFFQSHPVYSSIAEQSGTVFLTKTLSKLLLDAIQAALPDLSSRIDVMLNQTRKQMEKYGMFEPQAMDKSNQLLHVLKNFSDAIKATLDGSPTADEKAKMEITGGARIEWIFSEHVAPHIMSVDAAEQLTDERLRVTIVNMQAMKPGVFGSDRAFETLIREQILRLEPPSVRTVDFIFDELTNILRFSATMVAERFPELQRQLIDVAVQLLRELEKPTKEHVRTIIKAEHARINTKHPAMVRAMSEAQFGSGAGVAPPSGATAAGAAGAGVPGAHPNVSSANASGPGAPPHGRAGSFANPAAEAMHNWAQARPNAVLGAVPSRIIPTSAMAEHERLMCSCTRNMVCAYFKIVQQTVVDQTPKAIVLLLIDKLKESLHSRLVHELYVKAERLMAEPDDVVKTRAALTSMNQCLSRAQTAVNSVKDLRVV